MVKIKARSSESVDQLLRRFKKACEKEGLTRAMKRVAYYEKPSVTRNRKKRGLVGLGDLRQGQDGRIVRVVAHLGGEPQPRLFVGDDLRLRLAQHLVQSSVLGMPVRIEEGVRLAGAQLLLGEFLYLGRMGLEATVYEHQTGRILQCQQVGAGAADPQQVLAEGFRHKA
jgi:small subunit ribosomal protein S21